MYSFFLFLISFLTLLTLICQLLGNYILYKIGRILTKFNKLCNTDILYRYCNTDNLTLFPCTYFYGDIFLNSMFTLQSFFYILLCLSILCFFFTKKILLEKYTFINARKFIFKLYLLV